jgi:hypothetical protein
VLQECHIRLVIPSPDIIDFQILQMVRRGFINISYHPAFRYCACPVRNIYDSQVIELPVTSHLPRVFLRM